MTDRLKAISPGTPQWDAWLAHYRGTKSEARMLVCMAEARPFHAISEWPPEAPRADRLTSRSISTAPPSAHSFSIIDCRSHQIDALLDEIAERRAAKLVRDAAENEAAKRQRKATKHAEQTFEAARTAVLEGHEPYCNGAEHLGVARVVDPDDDVLRTKITALRDDPVGQMHRRGQLLTDEEKKKHTPQSVADGRLEAARRWQVLYECAEIGGAKAIDPSKEPVDGGRFVEPNTEASASARDRLHAVRRKLGFIAISGSQRILAERLLVWVLGEKKGLTQVAEMLGLDRRRLCLARHLIDMLDRVAIELRVATPKKRHRARPDDKYDATANRYLRSFQGFGGQ